MYFAQPEKLNEINAMQNAKKHYDALVNKT